MIRLVLAAAAAMLLSRPAAALTELGTITGAAGEDAYVTLPMLDSGPGVYGVKLRFDRPAAALQTEFVVTWTYNFYCNFGTGSFEYCGGDDVPSGGFYRTDAPAPLLVDGIYRIERPYSHFGPYFGETGYYFASGGYFDYYFAGAGTVHWQLDITRLADVPEPAAWLMMIAGFGLTGLAVRRRQVATA